MSRLYTLDQPSALFTVIKNTDEGSISRALMIVDVARLSPCRSQMLLAEPEDMALSGKNIVRAIGMQWVFFIKEQKQILKISFRVSS
jgi:hypothetical protein